MAALTSPRLRRAAFWIFVAALISQAAVLFRFSQSPHFLPSSDDMKFYNDWAMKIVGGQFTDGKAFYGLPGYAYLLAITYKIFGFDPFIVGAMQALAFAGVATVIFAVAAVSFRGTDESIDREPFAIAVGIIAAAGWIALVPAQTFSVILMPTAYVVLAYWGCVLWLMRRPSDVSNRSWFCLGAVIGVVSLVVATILFVIPMALFAIAKDALRAPDLRRRMLGALIPIVLLFAGVFGGTAPAWIHNYFIAHEPVLLSAHSGLNVWIGNNPGATGYPKIPPGMRASQEGLLKDSISLAQIESGKPLKRYEVSRYWSEKANNWIRNNRITWLRLIGTKIENFWNAFEYDDLTTIKLLETSGVLLPGIRFGLVSALGLPGLLLMAWRLPRSRWVLAAVVLHLLALLSVFVTERYRLAAAPGLLIGGAFGICTIYSALSERRWIAAAGLGAATAVFTVYVTLPRNDPGYWSLDHYKAGIRALDLNEMARAKTELESAYAYTPSSAEINFALGNYWFTEKQFPQAKAFYRAALDLDPKHTGAFNNLGVIMLEEKNLPWATKLFRRTLALDPEDAKAHYLLATSLFESGDPLGARKEIDEALRLRPEFPEFVAFRAKVAAPH